MDIFSPKNMIVLLIKEAGTESVEVGPPTKVTLFASHSNRGQTHEYYHGPHDDNDDDDY